VQVRKRKFTYIDLFSGGGGLSEGFLSAGFNPVAHIEMDYEACLTLKTRLCYHYLRKNNIYSNYLLEEINREQLYSSVPHYELDSVINQTMSKKTMPEIFRKIDDLMEKQQTATVDLITGGPPCQAYSLVGRAVTSDKMKNDSRNYLYLLYCRVLKKYQPKMFVFENVPGLLNANAGKYYKNMKMAFKRVGYNVHSKILNAYDFGVLQNRRRVILIGWKKGSNYEYPQFAKTSMSYTVSDLFCDLPIIQAGETKNSYLFEDVGGYLEDFGIRSKGDILTWNTARPHINRDKEIYRKVIHTWNQEKRRLKYSELPESLKTHKNVTSFLDRYKVVASDLPATHTMMAHISKDGHYFIHPDIDQARSITVREAARIQSFPDNFYFEGSRTSALTQIGNAVPPLMARGLAYGILEELERKDK